MLQEEYRKLGPLSFAELNVLLCFLLLVSLWFSRDPGFMPGWLSVAWAEGETQYVISSAAPSMASLCSVVEFWITLLVSSQIFSHRSS